MRLFSYRAIDQEGCLRKGHLAAASVEELDYELAGRGLDLISCRPTLRLFVRRLATRRDLIHFCFQLEQLVSAGVPLLDALSDLHDSLETGAFRDVLAGVAQRITEGASFSMALAAFPAVFDPLFTNLIRAGEQSGRLPEVLRDLMEGLKWQDELHARLRQVLTYPVFTALVIIGVALFLMLYLVPQLANFIRSMQGVLPLHTRALLAVSAFLQTWWPWLLVAPLCASGAAAGAHYHRRAAVWLDRYQLRIWFFGELVRKAELARFARLFALTYRAGIPMLEILHLAGEAVRNRAIREALAGAREAISEGQRITAAFEAAGLFPPLVLRMISTGETTGALDTALANVGYFYDRDVRERIGRLEGMLGPVLTLVLGALLGWIMLAVLGPLYDLIGRLRL